MLSGVFKPAGQRSFPHAELLEYPVQQFFIHVFAGDLAERMKRLMQVDSGNVQRHTVSKRGRSALQGFGSLARKAHMPGNGKTAFRRISGAGNKQRAQFIQSMT